jgi:uncharacterized membrane protein YgcG
MATVFLPNPEIQGLVHQTGLGSSAFWGRFVCNESLLSLYAALVTLMLGYGSKTQIDVVLKVGGRRGGGRKRGTGGGREGRGGWRGEGKEAGQRRAKRAA